MICISLLRAKSSLPPSSNTLRPRKRMVPAVGSISLKTSLAVVDFPQPLSPTSAMVSFRAREKLIPSTALTNRLDLEKNPSRRGKYFFKPDISRMVSVSSVLFIQPTTHLVSRFFLNQGRLFLSAHGHRHRTSRMKP